MLLGTALAEEIREVFEFRRSKTAIDRVAKGKNFAKAMGFR
jgi:hypothetical protein